MDTDVLNYVRNVKDHMINVYFLLENLWLLEVYQQEK